jgi:nitrite reductase/ring-hydroxylating ferredoxin subunit
MGEFVKVARVGDIRPGQRSAFWVEGVKVLVYNIDGTLHATDDSCPHRQCSLERALLNGTVVVCPCHAAQFDVVTGEVIVEPVGFPPTVPIPVHQVKIVGNDVLVALSTDIDSV